MLKYHIGELGYIAGALSEYIFFRHGYDDV
jgi:hypothetical protein